MTAYFIQAFIYLAAAVIAVPLAKRFGLGSVLGYLIAGVFIGPIAGLVGSETNTLQHFAEFGVVMMLFLVGLELEPRMLWDMRKKLIGLGGLQVGVTILVVMGIAIAFGFSWSVALTVGMIFSLSSTAIVLQTFNEKNLTKTEGGKNAFSVLLFQDIAVIPMLAFIPLLALPELVEKARSVVSTASEHHEELSLVAGLPGWAYGIVVLLAIASVVIGGHYLSRPLFRFVASSSLREIFTAAALMLVIGIAALMSLVGLSPALGTFLAGVVLANSEFRHELESVIEPFKGLLLGLFFITVGAGINFTVLIDNFGPVLAMTFGVIVIKALVLFLLAMIFKIQNSDRWLFALSLAQAGEFGFVLLSYSVQNHAIAVDTVQILSLVVALSMFLTPGLFILFDKVILPRYEQNKNTRDPDVIDEKGTVIIAGIGRFGQIVNRLLRTNGFKTVVIDHETQQVENMRKINTKSFYGDATKPDLLHTAGIADAKMLVIAIDNPDRAVALTEYIKHTYPHVIVLARAFDRTTLYRLRKAGADFMVSETFHSALKLGKHALTRLGVHPFKAEQQSALFFETELAQKNTLYEAWQRFTEDDKHLVHYRDMFIQLEETLSRAMKDERYRSFSKMERSWTPPPKQSDCVFSQSEKE
ncbi:monovalent cation:proton antiporter-2 (CPA2) family protein [Shewanella youngdeokensis]|uniref:Monovalent cation:proton antiporter-2 (CPA2) family protein n=1 Tax=Shewanella youngdeokensis TaxID=2999068 RepID=A0ABZ0JV37_9GAMM|nr:monovalent cation:proton antiporter-2 (CPA2) family protein [Shewanella sp. DAU334]